MIQPPDERLSAYLDGELSDDEVASLEAELERDPALKLELNRLLAVVRWVGEQGGARAPLGFHASVMDAVGGLEPARRSWPWGGFAVAAAAAAVLLVVGWPRGDQGLAPTWRESREEAAPAAAKLKDLGPKGGVGPSVQAADGSVDNGESAKPAPAAAVPAGSKDNADKDDAPDDGKAPPSLKEGPDGVDDEAPVLRTLPIGFTLTANDTKALRGILATVGKLGGTVHDESGALVTSATPVGHQQALVVRLPTSSLAEFQRALAQYGSAQASFNDEALYARSEVDVHLMIQWPSAPKGEEQKKAPPKVGK